MTEPMETMPRYTWAMHPSDGDLIIYRRVGPMSTWDQNLIKVSANALCEWLSSRDNEGA